MNRLTSDDTRGDVITTYLNKLNELVDTSNETAQAVQEMQAKLNEVIRTLNALLARKA